MRVDSIGNTNVTFTGLRVNCKDNKEVKFLYNKLSDIVKECKSPAVFTRDFVDIGKDDKSVIEKLVEKGIKFIKNDKL